MYRILIGTSPSPSPANIEVKINAVIRKQNPEAPEELGIMFARWGGYMGIKPEILAAISMLETGWWKFGRLVQPSWNNPAGIKCGCEGGGAGCAQASDGHYFRTFSSIEAGIKMFAGHVHSYLWGDENKKGQTYDPCWSAWQRNAIKEFWGANSQSLMAVYTMWREGKAQTPTQATADIVERIAEIADEILVEEVGDGGGGEEPPDGLLGKKGWLLIAGLMGIALFLFSKAKPKGIAQSKQGGVV